MGSCGRVASGLASEGGMTTAILRSDFDHGMKNEPVSADRAKRKEEFVGEFGVEPRFELSLARADGCSRGRALTRMNSRRAQKRE